MKRLALLALAIASTALGQTPAPVPSPSSTPPGGQGAIAPPMIDNEALRRILYFGGNGMDAINGVRPVIEKKIAAATYSPSVFSNLGANATLNVKATTGNIYSLFCHNLNAATRYIQIHNTATVPGAGAVPVLTFPVPAGGDRIVGTDFFSNEGVNFSTGIAFAFSTTEATYTAATAADQTTVITFK